MQLNGEIGAPLERAGLLCRAGRHAEAEASCRAALDSNPQSLEGRVMLGVILCKQGRFPEAVIELDQALAAEPGSFDALMWRSITARQLGCDREATHFAERAVDAAPGDFRSQNHLGLCLLNEGRCREAISNFQRALGQNPNHIATLFNLATALQFEGRFSEACGAYRRALTLAPELTDALVALGTLYQDMGNLDEALKSAKRAVRQAPGSAGAHLLLAGLYLEQGETPKGSLHFESGSNLSAGDQFAFLRGTLLRTLGRMDEAIDLFQRDIEAKPVQGLSYCYLAYSRRNHDQVLVERMQRIAEAETMPLHESAAIHYGLGKALEDLGDFERAMGHYDEANRRSHEIRFGDRRFDTAAYRRSNDAVIARFQPGTVEWLLEAGNPSEVPIFIVGMMRSGTTLVEQVLSSHSQVEGSGEQAFWSLNWARILDRETGTPSADRAVALAGEYLESISQFRNRSSRVTDKMPRNYAVLGAIRLAFPRARIIHVRRHPVDTCLSIYTTPNRANVEFAHDQRAILAAYQEYQRLLNHWEECLPGDRFLTVDYEDLVTDRERVIRRLLEFCGLDWEDSCLNHEQNPRSVSTPSAWQVRQPMYSSSVGRWRRFEPWLGEFGCLLAAGVRPTSDHPIGLY